MPAITVKARIMTTERLHAIVRGEVQGVFFRANTQQRAAELSLTGWVMNRKDGGVEVVAEGEREPLERLLGWLRHGPPAASVEKVDSEWGEATGEFPGFEVRYA